MSELAPNTQTTTPAVVEKPKTIGEYLASQKKQIEAALPKHLDADRMLRIVMTEIRKTPKLKLCTVPSLIGSVLQCAQLGLEPGSALGHAWLLPYDNRKLGITECQFMLGYRGMADLAWRSGKVMALNARCVYSKDEFSFQYGLNEDLKHIPTSNPDRGHFIAAYIVVRLIGGAVLWRVMYKNEIDEARARSKSPDRGPWVTDYDEMAMKTVFRRVFKYAPVSIEMQRAITLDEAADRGEQRNGLIIEGELDESFEDPKSKAEALDKTLSD